MRVGIFTDSYYPHISGVSTSIDMLTRTLRKMGHKVFIVAPNLDNNKFIYDKENEIIWIPGIKTGLYKLKLAELYSRKAMKIIKNEWNLDVIHSQTEFGVGYFSRIVSKRLNIPVVHTYHTLYEDYVYYITHGHLDRPVKKLAINLTKYYCDKKCDELIVPTDKIKDLFNKKYGIVRKMAVIPTGIDTKRFDRTKESVEESKKIRRQYKINDDDFVIGAVGRVAQEKSFDKIIINLSKLVKINNKIKFMLVGSGPDIDNLKELAKKMNVENNVIFTGLVDYNLISKYYLAFDVMVSFSKTETQGLTIIEGLAASLPVICIQDESFETFIQNNYNGYLFKNDDEFKKYILDIMSDKKLYQMMSMNAKNSIYSYSKEVFTSRVLRIYYKAIDKKNSKNN